MFFLSACCHHENVTCVNGTLQINLVGSIATDTAYVIRYKQDGIFDHPIDTLIGTDEYYNGNDTSYLRFQSVDTIQTSYVIEDSFGAGLLLGYDYKVLIPADTVTFTITGLNPTGTTQMEMSQCGDKSVYGCHRNAYNCTINGVSTTTLLFSTQIPGYENGGTTVYLTK